MDVLSDIFETVQLRGALYFRTDFSAPWGTTVPDYRNAARFHLVVRGRCHVVLASGATVDLTPGEMILVPRGRAHTLAHAPGADAPPLERVLEAAGFAGEGVLAIGEGDEAASTRMVCGHFTFAEGADHPLLRALPDHLLVTPAVRAAHPWLDKVLNLLVENVFSAHQGSMAAVTRLSEVVFIESIRSGAEIAPELGRVLTGFADPQVGRALALIHADGGRRWTVETLARAVAMSRSSFAERFQSLMGCGPMTYVSDWRLQQAMALLMRSNVSVREVARRAGYLSATAFTRAFTARFEKSPTAFRRETH